jgi:hypothetical protein
LEKEQAYLLCKQHIHRYVVIQVADGSSHDGIVENVDEEILYLAVPMGGTEAESTRAFLPYGYPSYGYGYGYGYPYPGPFYPRRRFYRRAFPLAGLLGLSLLPYY